MRANVRGVVRQIFPATAAALGLTVLLSGAPARAQSADQKAIRGVWKTYVNAVATKQGKIAARLVSNASLEYYGRMRNAALRAPPGQVSTLGVVDLIMVYQMRHLLTGTKLSAMSSTQVVAWTINTGLSASGNIRAINLDAIVVAGDTARSAVSSSGRRLDWQAKFIRDSGGWRFSVLAQVQMANRRLAQILKSRNASGPNFVVSLLRRQYGDAIDVAKLRRPMIGR